MLHPWTHVELFDAENSLQEAWRSNGPTALECAHAARVTIAECERAIARREAFNRARRASAAEAVFQSFAADGQTVTLATGPDGRAYLHTVCESWAIDETGAEVFTGLRFGKPWTVRVAA